MDYQNKHIVFTAHVITPRQQKMALWLRKRGWRVTILTVIGSEDKNEYFSNICYFTDLRDLLVTAKALSPQLFHCFCPCIDYVIAETLIRHQVGPIVCDFYDQINYVGRDESKSPSYIVDNGPRETFCIENAQGLCARDLQLTHYKRNGAFPTGKPILFFPEYGWGLDIPLLPKRRHTDGKVHMVMAGGVFDFDEWLPLLKTCLDFGFLVHVYPFYNAKIYGDFNRAFAPYIEASQINPNFQFHKPVYGFDMITEISQYDICPHSDMAQLFNSPRLAERFSPGGFRRWYSNRLSDCVDAGIYYIGNEPQFVTWLASRLGGGAGGRVGGGADWNDLQNPTFWQNLIGKLDQIDFAGARRSWSMERNIDRLIAFYDRVASGS
jgi:hypothetical protein